MISCPTVRKEVIRDHYNVSTLFYRLLWGEHIHHGYWEADESPKVAQRKLIERLVEAAQIQQGAKVLDVGCGMGGSSRYLADELGCHVTGITLSPFQRRWAAMSTRFRRSAGQTEFQCADAETIQLSSQNYDNVWSIECTEHLFDKPAFFQRVADWLRPGGRVSICAWLAGDEHSLRRPEARQAVYDVCEGFFCPSLGSSEDYQSWMRDAGLVIERVEDWTDNVARTWEICGERIRRFGMHRVADFIDRGQHIFLDRFDTLLGAYRTRAMEYGAFVARKPE